MILQHYLGVQWGWKNFFFQKLIKITRKTISAILGKKIFLPHNCPTVRDKAMGWPRQYEIGINEKPQEANTHNTPSNKSKITATHAHLCTHAHTVFPHSLLDREVDELACNKKKLNKIADNFGILEFEQFEAWGGPKWPKVTQSDPEWPQSEVKLVVKVWNSENLPKSIAHCSQASAHKHLGQWNSGYFAENFNQIAKWKISTTHKRIGKIEEILGIQRKCAHR